MWFGYDQGSFSSLLYNLDMISSATVFLPFFLSQSFKLSRVFKLQI